MTAKVGQIIEVIEEVRRRYRTASASDPIHQIRIDAAHSVATRREITYQAVIDKFRRQLSPDIVSTSEFDSLLKSWLVGSSNELRDIVLRHIVDTQDEPLIRNAFHIAPEQDILLSEEFGLEANGREFQEGREKLRVHLTKERNRHLVDLAKVLWLKNGQIRCSICSFSFTETYGDVGKGYIEAHHTTPISEIAPDTVVRPSDLAPVCSNCHGIIHRYRPWLTIEQMQKIVSK